MRLKRLLFRLGQLSRWTSDDGLGHFERKRMGAEYMRAVMAPLSPSERAALDRMEERYRSPGGNLPTQAEYGILDDRRKRKNEEDG